MRFVVVFGMLWILVGCSAGPLSKTLIFRPGGQEQDRFSATLDRFAETGQVDVLETFQQDYPESSWHKQVAGLVRSARLQSQQKSELLGRNQQLGAELTRLEEENRLLNEKIEQLKRLLIELEQRPR